MATATDTMTIRLGGHLATPTCAEMAWTLWAQLRDRYRYPASVLPIGDHAEYLAEHRTARKRAARARRLGYVFAEIDRSHHEDAIFRVNVSMPERQGRPMTAAYRERQTFGANAVVCDHHHVYTYGVLADGELVAYLWLYRCGEVALVSSILGHADHLAGDVMYLLVTEALRAQESLGGTCFYNMHDSGTAGLVFFKERLGFRPAEVEWLL
jgi:hypothetical protein